MPNEFHQATITAPFDPLDAASAKPVGSPNDPSRLLLVRFKIGKNAGKIGAIDRLKDFHPKLHEWVKQPKQIIAEHKIATADLSDDMEIVHKPCKKPLSECTCDGAEARLANKGKAVKQAPKAADAEPAEVTTPASEEIEWPKDDLERLEKMKELKWFARGDKENADYNELNRKLNG